MSDPTKVCDASRKAISDKPGKVCSFHILALKEYYFYFGDSISCFSEVFAMAANIEIDQVHSVYATVDPTKALKDSAKDKTVLITGAGRGMDIYFALWCRI